MSGRNERTTRRGAERTTAPLHLPLRTGVDRPWVARDALHAEDFDVEYRVRMVKAYPVISGVPDAFEASWSDIEAGFERVLVARNLRRTHEMYLGAHRRRSGVSGG